jgi:hypothetical protein
MQEILVVDSSQHVEIKDRRASNAMTPNKITQNIGPELHPAAKSLEHKEYIYFEAVL